MGWSDSDLVSRRASIWRDRHRGFPQALRGGAADRAPVDAVAAVAGARCVVDTSKYAARALRLHRAHPRLDLLWVQREPRGLAASLLRERGSARHFNVPEAVMYDAVVDRSWRAVARRLPVRSVQVDVLWERGARGLIDLAVGLELPLRDERRVGTWGPSGHVLTAHEKVAQATHWQAPSGSEEGARSAAAGWVMSMVRGRRQR